MATRRTPLNENLNTANVLNAVRNDIGGSYAANVPAAYSVGAPMENGENATTEQALERLQEIGQTILQFPAYTNSFLDQLVNRIAYTLISSRLYRNPWSVFKRGFLEMGETVEELFVNLANPHQFDPETAETEVFKREIPDVRAAFHPMNYQKFYKVTVSRSELKLAFLSWDGLNNLVQKIIETLYTGANYDEFLMMKYLIAKSAINGEIHVEEISAPTLANADSIVQALRTVSQNVQYMSTEYNHAGVTTYTDLSSQYFIMSNEFSGVIDVGSQARAFNLDKVELLARTIGVNNFSFTTPELQRLALLINLNSGTPVFTSDELAALSKIQCMLVDRDWFMIFDNEDYMDSLKNPQGIYFNHFYHVWKTFSASPFNTAILFTTETQSVTAVNVTPKTASVVKGGQVQLTAAVTGTDFVDKSVVWSVNSDVSSISDSGLLTVNPAETKTSLTVTATSVADSTKSGTATITVTTS